MSHGIALGKPATRQTSPGKTNPLPGVSVGPRSDREKHGRQLAAANKDPDAGSGCNEDGDQNPKIKRRD